MKIKPGGMTPEPLKHIKPAPPQPYDPFEMIRSLEAQLRVPQTRGSVSTEDVADLLLEAIDLSAIELRRAIDKGRPLRLFLARIEPMAERISPRKETPLRRKK